MTTDNEVCVAGTPVSRGDCCSVGNDGRFVSIKEIGHSNSHDTSGSRRASLENTPFASSIILKFPGTRPWLSSEPETKNPELLADTRLADAGIPDTSKFSDLGIGNTYHQNLTRDRSKHIDRKVLVIGTRHKLSKSLVELLYEYNATHLAISPLTPLKPQWVPAEATKYGNLDRPRDEKPLLSFVLLPAPSSVEFRETLTHVPSATTSDEKVVVLLEDESMSTVSNLLQLCCDRVGSRNVVVVHGRNPGHLVLLDAVRLAKSQRFVSHDVFRNPHQSGDLLSQTEGVQIGQFGTIRTIYDLVCRRATLITD